MPWAWCLPIAMQSGCCKPPDNCKFTYVRPTYWNKENGNFTDADCRLWDNRPGILCYDCASCKAGLLDRINRQWKTDANLNAVVLLVLVIVFIVGCCSLSENRTKVHAYRTNPYPYASSPYFWVDFLEVTYVNQVKRFFVSLQFSKQFWQVSCQLLITPLSMLL